MKILISIFVLLISFNLKAEYLHCDEFEQVEGSSLYNPIRKFHILSVDFDKGFITNYEFKYRSDSYGKYSNELLESLLSDEYNYKDYLQTNLEEFMSQPEILNFKIIRNNIIQIHALNTSNERYKKDTWLNLNLINGLGFLRNQRIKCEIIENNLFGDWISHFEKFIVHE